MVKKQYGCHSTTQADKAGTWARANMSYALDVTSNSHPTVGKAVLGNNSTY